MLCLVCVLVAVTSGETGGKWSQTGCSVSLWSSFHVECTCDHLTHFAVLVETRDKVVRVGVIYYKSFRKTSPAGYRLYVLSCVYIYAMLHYIHYTTLHYTKLN